jgi:XRE family transcriptional regulator, regulator of sulfur utilization
MLTKRDLMISVVAICATLCVVAVAQSNKPVMNSSAFDWSSTRVDPQKYGSRRLLFHGPTTTLEDLDCHVTTLNPGESPHSPHQHPEEELMVVKEGTLEVLVNGEIKRVGPGSVVFQASNQLHSIRNVGQTQATYHVFKWVSPGMSKSQPKK